MPWVLGPLLAPELLAALPELLAAALFLALIIGLAVWLEPLVASVEGRRTGGLLHIIDIPGRFIRSAAASAYHAVAHSISVAASHRMRPFAAWFGGAAAWLATTSGSVADFAWDTALALERGYTVVLPREIGKATRPIRQTARRALEAALGAAAAVTALRHWMRHLYSHEIRPAIRHATHAVDVAIPRALGRLRARERALEREIEHPSTRWLRRIATAMFATTLLGLMIRTLARRFPWLFCRKVKSVGNRVCSVDNDLLGWALSGTLLAMSPFTLEDFARQAVGTLDLFVDGLDTLLQDLHLAEPDYLGGTAGGLPSSFTDYLD